jgi:hypothetical protein
MGEKSDKKALQKLSAGIFTGVMILLCAALYFFSGKAPRNSTASKQNTVTPTPAFHLAQADDFVRGKSYYTLYEDTDGTTVYQLKAELAAGTLTLSLSEYGVYEFVLSTELIGAPDALAKNATEIDRLTFQKLNEQLEEQTAWIEKEASELLTALDKNGSITPARSEAFLFALNSTIFDCKSRNLSWENIDTEIFHYKDDGNLLVVTVCLSEK